MSPRQGGRADEQDQPRLRRSHGAISGRIGRALVTEGALVSAAEATQLALIQQTNIVYVNFTQSSTEVLRMRKAMAAKQLVRVGGDAVAVKIILEDGTELPRAASCCSAT